jgi:hypothetical protein
LELASPWGLRADVATTGYLYVATGSNIITNAGLMEATAGGTLQIGSTLNNTGFIEATAGSSVYLYAGVNNGGSVEANGDGSSLFLSNTVNNTSGVLEAIGTGARIVLQGATITGTVQAAAGAEIEVTSSGNLFDGSATPFTDIGSVVVDAGSVLTLRGTIDNLGTITVNGNVPYYTNYGQVEIDGNVMLTGGGQIVLAGTPYYSAFLAGASAGSILNNVDNTISGGGYLAYNASTGSTNLTLVNDAAGIIDATTGYLYVATGSNIITNAGLMEATAGGTLQIGSTLNNTGFIEATAGSSVYLYAGVNNGGSVEANGGNVTISGIDSGGNAIIAGATFEFGAASYANVVFASSSGTLKLDTSSSFHGSISGLGAQNAIDLRDINVSNITTKLYTPNFDNTGGVLTVSDGTRTATLDLAGPFTQGSFGYATDTAGGTLITYPGSISIPIGTWSITPGSQTVNETDGVATFIITRSSDAYAQTVYISTTQDHGTLNTGDYVGLYNQPFTIPAGHLFEPISIQINSGTTAEPDETFGLIVQQSPIDPINPNLASATFTIHDDQVAQQVSALSIEPADVTELVSGLTAYTFTVARAGGDLSQPVSVDWSVDGENAADFVNPYFEDVFPAGIITFNPGDTTPKTITVDVKNNLLPKDALPEGFQVSLSNPSAGATIDSSHASANGLVQNDEPSITAAAISAMALLAMAAYGANDFNGANAIDALDASGWQFLNATDLNLSSASFIGDEFQGNSTSFLGGAPEALVAVDYAEHAIAIAFKGSTDLADLLASVGQRSYFDQMIPLINAALTFAEDHPNEIQNIYITGHSLGGVLADWTALEYGQLIESLKLTPSIVTFGSPGINQSTETQDAADHHVVNSGAVAQNILNFGNPDDPIFEQGQPLTINATPPDLGQETMLTSELQKIQLGVGGEHRDGTSVEMTLPNINPFDSFIPANNYEHYVLFYEESVEAIAQSYFYNEFVADPNSHHKVVVDTLIDPADQRPLNSSSETQNVFIVGNPSVSNTITGGSGDDWIQGGKGNDILNGGPGNDILAGGGGANNFVFKANFGKDVIVDFNPNIDSIQINQATFANTSILLAHTADNAQGNAVITADANDTITLVGVTTSQLQQHLNDFHLV